MTNVVSMVYYRSKVNTGNVIEAMRPTRDPLVVALAALAIAAFVALVGWNAMQTYGHNGRLSGLEWRLKASEEEIAVLSSCHRLEPFQPHEERPKR